MASSSIQSTQISAQSDPSFEVATIKQTPPDRAEPDYPSIDTHSRSLVVKSATVIDLIKWAYRLREEQIENASQWMAQMKFDIVGQPDMKVQPNADQDRLMMRKLLAERFNLVMHETRRVSTVYVLSVNAKPSQMLPSTPQDGHVKLSREEANDGTTALQFSSATMQDLLYVLMNSIQDRQIVDETGLKGKYDFTLILPSETLESNTDASELSAGLLKALESIGLQVNRRKDSVQMFVVDRINEPTPN